MKTTKLMLITTFFFSVANAQETMIPDVSPAYLERLVKASRANYAKFKWTSAKVNTAEIGVNRAKLSWFDFLQVSYYYTPSVQNEVTNNTGYNSNGYQLGFFMNIGNILQKPAVVRQAKSDVLVARFDKEVVDMNIEAQVKQRYYTYVSRMNILKLRSSVQADAADLLKSLKFKFEKGQITFESYNQARISYSGITQEKITSEAEMLIAKSSLEELLGTSIENLQ